MRGSRGIKEHVGKCTGRFINSHEALEESELDVTYKSLGLTVRNSGEIRGRAIKVAHCTVKFCCQSNFLTVSMTYSVIGLS